VTTHVGVFDPLGPRLFWASDRKATLRSGMRYERLFQPVEKHAESERVWVAASGVWSHCRAGLTVAHSAESAEDFVERMCDVASWGEDGPSFLVCDSQGLCFVTGEGDLLRAKPWMPLTIGSGSEYAQGALRALLPGIPTSRTKWSDIVRRAVLAAGECDEATEGVECGVWSPGPRVVELPGDEVAA